MKNDQNRKSVFISCDWPIPNLLRSEREGGEGVRGREGREKEREGRGWEGGKESHKVHVNVALLSFTQVSQ